MSLQDGNAGIDHLILKKIIEPLLAAMGYFLFSFRGKGKGWGEALLVCC